MVKIGEYDMPDELYYHEKHMWLRKEKDGNVRIGMNDFTQKMAGDIVYVDVPPQGSALKQDEDFGTIESGKWVGKIVSPISGEVTEENEKVIDDPTLVNSEPYGEGWIAVVKPSNLDSELKNLFHGPNVADWLKKEEEEAQKIKEEKK